VKALAKLLWRNKPYLVLSLATLLSGIGTAFSSIAVYGEFVRQGATPFYYSLAFVLAVLPGLFTSLLAGRFANRLNTSTVLIAAELVGAASLAFPIFGVTTGHLYFLLFAEFMGSALTGFLVPFHQSYVRRAFKNEELPLVSAYGVYIFTANFILGQGLGTLIYGFIGSLPFFVVDFFTYVTAAGLIALSAKLDPSSYAPLEASEAPPRAFRWAALRPIQKRVFLIMQLLPLVCAPPMSLLPARGAEFGGALILGSFALAPSLLFLLLKTLGQLLGPQMVVKLNLDKLISSGGVLVACLAGYLGFYYLIFTTSNFWLAAACVVLAHVCSNVVYIVASYGFSRHFDELEIASAAARNYQAAVLSMSVSGFLAGLIAENFSVLAVLAYSLLPLSLALVYLAAPSEREAVRVA